MKGGPGPRGEGPAPVFGSRMPASLDVLLSELGLPDGCKTVQDHWRTILARELYGQMPPPPRQFEIESAGSLGVSAEHIRLHFTHAVHTGVFDTVLWLPKERHRPAPVIRGLDLIGPAGILNGDICPLDPNAVICTRPEFSDLEGRLDDVLRGNSVANWPVSMMHYAGFAVLVNYYSSWVPDDPAVWRHHGLYRPFHLGSTSERVGAITLWALTLQRMVDLVAEIPELNPDLIAVARRYRLPPMKPGSALSSPMNPAAAVPLPPGTSKLDAGPDAGTVPALACSK